ncbi:uncharacterized protein [Ptychodera flava]|uniref:uncharacterized protein n=1 Tax=Ptychodera flava TaxID=63121 RepID=UPI00396A3FBE
MRVLIALTLFAHMTLSKSSDLQPVKPMLDGELTEEQRLLFVERRSVSGGNRRKLGSKTRINTRVCGRVHPHYCKDGSYCLYEHQVCDSFKHCNDGSDEDGCFNAPTKAYIKESVCGDKHPYLCIDRSFCLYTSHICDGTNHCSDGSDEFECDSYNASNAYVSKRKKAELDYDLCKDPHPYGCVDGSYCIYPIQICNSIEDCKDGSDERECDPYKKRSKAYLAEGYCRESAPYLCLDGGYCLGGHLLCSGIAECKDSSDEFDCDFEKYYGTLDGKCRIETHVGNTGWRDLANQLLDAHNYFRCLHGSKPLRWSKKLEKLSIAAANASAEKGSELTHSYGRYPENLAYAGKINITMATGFGIIKMFYDEISLFNFDKPVRKEATGHFITMMWHTARRLGCGYARGPDGEYQMACQYSGQHRRKTLRQSIRRPL